MMMIANNNRSYNKAQQEVVTYKGRLKSNIFLKSSKNGDPYYSAPLEINQAEVNGRALHDYPDSIFLIFWKKDFEKREQITIEQLTEGKTIIVHGNLAGRDNTLLKVIDLEVESDSEEGSIFI